MEPRSHPRRAVVGALLALLWTPVVLLGACGGAAAPPADHEVVWGAGRGQSVALPFDGDAPATALVFVSTTCPIANAYAPRLRALHARFEDLGARLVLVQVEEGLTAGAAAAHGAQFGTTAPVVLDPDRRLVRLAGVTVTPEAAVFDAGGALLYRGRIDDGFPDLGSRRAPTTAELRDAVEAVCGGKGDLPGDAPAVGCLIEGAGQ